MLDRMIHALFFKALATSAHQGLNWFAVESPFTQVP